MNIYQDRMIKQRETSSSYRCYASSYDPSRTPNQQNKVSPRSGCANPGESENSH